MGGFGAKVSCRWAGWPLAVLFATLGLSSCSSGPGESVSDTVAVQPVPVVLHRVGPVADGTITATGTVRLRRETPLAFLADGRLRSLAVREGDRVKAGQLLGALDPTAIDAAALAAEARARQASAELARQRTLQQQGWVSKARVEAAEAAARAAEADRTAARFTQRYATISAPADGIVLARLAEPGQTLAAGSPVLLLGEFASGFVLRAPMSAGQAAGLSVGTPAKVVFRDAVAPPMAGRVIEVAGRADPRTGTFQVEFALPADPALRSGLIADAILLAAPVSAPLVVPASALFAARADEGFVWRYDEAKQQVVPNLVKLGAVREEGVELLSGLSTGVLIVAAGVDRLVAGQKVKPVSSAAPARVPSPSTAG